MAGCFCFRSWLLPEFEPSSPTTAKPKSNDDKLSIQQSDHDQKTKPSKTTNNTLLEVLPAAGQTIQSSTCSSNDNVDLFSKLPNDDFILYILRKISTQDHLFSKLPEDVFIFYIPRKLSTKDLLSLMHVSKLFKHLISQPYFLDLHILSITANPTPYHHLLFLKDSQYQYRFYLSYHDDTGNNSVSSFRSRKTVEIPFPPSGIHRLKVEGSAQGVIFFSHRMYGKSYRTLSLWNPLIGEFKRLPCVQLQPRCNSPVLQEVYGFGLDPVSVDFKVVKISYYDWESIDQAEAFVYSHKAKSWTSVAQKVPCSPYYIGGESLCGNYHNNVCVSGVVYWLAHYKQPPRPDINPYIRPPDCLMGFDLVHRVFKVVELPKTVSILGMLRLFTWLDGKSLAVSVEHYSQGDCCTTMFVMNDDGMSEEVSWERKFTILNIDYIIPQMMVSSRVFIGLSLGKRNAVLIDVENGEMTENLPEHSGLPPFTGIIAYHPSLALLDS